MSYRLRPAALDDLATITHHRVAMFRDMGVEMDEAVVSQTFIDWLAGVMADGTYRGWLVEAEPGEVVAGGGITLLPWPPGPRYPGGRLAFVYNVYTEPAHRRHGLARMVMDAIHAWCLAHNVTSVGLNASESGRPLYESMGYEVTRSPMMFRALTPSPK
ncbi:MAG: GNAT family N-acetyltransferase [Acidobacteriota bacterium]